jgi:hypothetical protein
MQLDGGSYEIRPAAGDRIAVRLTGNVGAAKADISVEGAQADVKVQDTPHNNFHATIEVPKTADLVVQLSGGNLDMAAIAGNKDIESTAGNVTILVGNPDDYASVDAAVKAGDLNAPAFGGAKSGLLQQFNWSGRGKYRLRVRLGAGNLELRI